MAPPRKHACLETWFRSSPAGSSEPHSCLTTLPIQGFHPQDVTWPSRVCLHPSRHRELTALWAAGPSICRWIRRMGCNQIFSTGHRAGPWRCPGDVCPLCSQCGQSFLLESASCCDPKPVTPAIGGVLRLPSGAV